MGFRIVDIRRALTLNGKIVAYRGYDEIAGNFVDITPDQIHKVHGLGGFYTPNWWQEDYIKMFGWLSKEALYPVNGVQMYVNGKREKFTGYATKQEIEEKRCVSELDDSHIPALRQFFDCLFTYVNLNGKGWEQLCHATYKVHTGRHIQIARGVQHSTDSGAYVVYGRNDTGALYWKVLALQEENNTDADWATLLPLVKEESELVVPLEDTRLVSLVEKLIPMCKHSTPSISGVRMVYDANSFTINCVDKGTRKGTRFEFSPTDTFVYPTVQLTELLQQARTDRLVAFEVFTDVREAVYKREYTWGEFKKGADKGLKSWEVEETVNKPEKLLERRRHYCT